ncbi:MAG: Coenzyme F420 hydrogenase/dehydrogenase, beta subunit C-terminal domain [Clostridia bacterium]|nr:Coenzyme F420 hydrogenase/dehydrogenase, beta subunit C-terminal domain [Clostridia bacterium]
MIKISDKTMCTGCSACYSICPKSAIEMKTDEEGFQYPEIVGSKCIECNLCSKVCPQIEPFVALHNSTNKYAIQSTDEQLRALSTAGGFFSVLADYVISDCNGVVFGAGFDGVDIVHKGTEHKDDIPDMCGSKYVQSYLGDVFSHINDLLSQGRCCLFVGTPCQVNGLKKLVQNNKNEHLLITTDLICYGVSSPGIYKKWINFLQKKYKDNVRRVVFRDKSYGYSAPNTRIYFQERKHIEQNYDSKSMLRMFFAGYNMRPSCYDCEFRSLVRASDFTIGDFHSVGDQVPGFDDELGTTAVWVHSEYGKEIFELLKQKIRWEPVESGLSSSISGSNKILKIPKNREEFFLDVKNCTYEQLTSKWVKNNLKSRIVNLVKPVINKLPLKKHVFKLVKKYKQKKYEKRVRKANEGGHS